MSIKNGKCCSNCVYSFLEDVGYSDYTVEGTDVECLIEVHPKKSFADDSRDNNYAEKCKEFEQGIVVHISVEGTNPFTKRYTV